MQLNLFQSAGDYIDGQFVKSLDQNKKEIWSPADLSDKVFEYSTNLNHVEVVCEVAQKSYPLWSNLSQETRNNYLKKLMGVYQQKESEISELISRETGKALWESQIEAQGLAQKINVVLQDSLPLVTDKVIPVLKSGVDAKIVYRSKGVFLVIGPFNFPMHLPNGHIIAALALGNTVIFKPSEKSPACAEKLAQCFDLAGFPKGVFNVIQGGSTTAQLLVQHPKIDGILFTGSYKVGNKIQKQIQNQDHKILALEMGGKNSSVVWKDADIDTALYEVLKGVYLTCGQRCSATSRLILHKDIKDQFLEKFIKLSKRIRIGHWRDRSFMGPLIDQVAVDRFSAANQEALKQGAVVHLSGERLSHLNGYYVSPSIVEPKCYNPHSFYQAEELFSPFLTVYCVDQMEQAIQFINQGGYGLCLSVFSQQEPFVKSIFQKAKVGVFHWNLSTNGASSQLPFGGLGKSGNHQAAGLFAVYSCVTPVAWMQKADNKKSGIFDFNLLYNE